MVVITASRPLAYTHVSLCVSVCLCVSAVVVLDQAGCMIWPVVFLYPESGHNDFIEQFAEVSTFQEHLDVCAHAGLPCIAIAALLHVSTDGS
jgi:hypothetical protein